MPFTTAQLTAAYVAARDGIAPDPATASLLSSYAGQTQSAALSDSAALGNVINFADSTTAVAVQAYQFFTGLTPNKGGLDFLVNSPSNPNDLNDPSYAPFNIENRYINFAANLGISGQGSAAFASTYGSLSFSNFVTVIYEAIIGTPYAQAAGINVAAAIADINSRQSNFVSTAMARGLITASSTAAQIDIATKASVVGYLLVEGIKADVGIYAAGSNSFTLALINGTAQYNVNLLSVYSPLGGGTGSPVATASAVFNLTTGADNVAAAATNDTVAGTIFSDSVANSTFSAADTLSGGGGLDTLNLLVTKTGGGATGAVTVPAASVTGYETINLRSLSTTVGDVLSANATAFSGATTVASDRSTNAVTITNLAAGAAAGEVGDGVTVNGALTFGYAAAASPAILNITGGTKASAIVLSTAAPSVTLNSGGAANAIGTFALGGAATSLTVNATTSISTGAISGFTGPATITVNGLASVVSLGAIDSTVTTLNAAGLSAGGVAATIGANAALAFTGGAGSDTVTVAAGLGATITGTIDGAAGSDTVVFQTGADLVAASAAKFINFETVQLINGGAGATLQTYTPNLITGAAVQIGASTGSVQAQGLAAGGSVTVTGTLTGTGVGGALTVLLANASGASDSATVTLNNGATAASVNAGGVGVAGLTLGGVTAGQVETLNLVSGGAVTGTGGYNSLVLAGSGAGPAFADPNTVVVTGTAGLTLTTGTLAHNLSVNASALTGTGGLNFASTGGAVSVTVVGSAVNDTIIFAAGQTGIILGGAGADAIIITAATGSQTIAYTKATDSLLDLTGSPGTSNIGTPVTGVMDFIGGFQSGVDKISLSGISASLTGTIADKGAAASAAAVTTLLATSTFFQDGIGTLQKIAQFDYSGGTLLVADTNLNGVYDSGDLVIFLAGINNVASGDIN